MTMRTYAYTITITVSDDTELSALEWFGGTLEAQAMEPVGSVDEYGNETLIDSTRYTITGPERITP